MSFPLILKQPKQVLHRGIFTPWASVTCLQCHGATKKEDCRLGGPTIIANDFAPMADDYDVEGNYEAPCKCECGKTIVVHEDVAANKRFVDLVNALPLNERHTAGLSMDQTGGMTPGFSGPVGESGWVSGVFMDDSISFSVFFADFDIDADWSGEDADLSESFEWNILVHDGSEMKEALAFMKKAYQGGE